MQEGRSLQFIFDEVHGPPNGAGNTQADIFSDIQDIVLGTVPWVTLEGVNGCVMAYGQTGCTPGLLLTNTCLGLGLLCMAIPCLLHSIEGVRDYQNYS